MVDYAKVRQFTVFVHCIGSVLLFITSISRFFQLDFSSTTFVLSIYYIGFGVLIILSELRIERVLRHFYFMNFSFGKAVFAGFVATLTFSLSLFQLVVGSFFIVACGGFLILGFIYTRQEAKDAVPKPRPSSAAEKPDEQKLPAGGPQIELQDVKKAGEKPADEIAAATSERPTTARDKLPAPLV